MYTGAHVQDVGNEEVEFDFDNLVVNNVATSLSAPSMNIMNDMDLEWTRIRQRRTKIVK